MKSFSKISEWVAAGGLETGLYLVENITAETEKAFGIAAQKLNSFGNLKPATCWVPKSKAVRVENDLYTHGGPVALLVPAWLFRAKMNEGFEL